jgi:hypothetical protein
LKTFDDVLGLVVVVVAADVAVVVAGGANFFVHLYLRLLQEYTLF